MKPAGLARIKKDCMVQFHAIFSVCTFSSSWVHFVYMIVAMLTMLIDHIGVAFFPEVKILRIIGRIAFPLFGLELARGRRRTRSLRNYLLRLSVLAGVSQIPYMLFFASREPNILFTLLLSLLILLALDRKIYIAAAGLFALTLVLPFNYGCYGPLIIFLIDRIDQGDFKFSLAYFAVNLFAGLQGFAVLAYPFFRIRDKKILPGWVAYSFYPAHLILLFLLLKI